MKIKIYVLLFIMMVAFTTPLLAESSTASHDPVKTLTEEEIAVRMAEMRQRVEEIKAIDRSSLTKGEKKALRTELKQMNEEAHAMEQRGVYLSVGAIIIIILLLILIL